MNKKVYFSGSIRGGREDAGLYGRIIRLIQKTDIVLTEHIGSADYPTACRSLAEEQAVYRQDTAWLRACDLVIAECSQPSLGVGYEMAYAEQLGKPVYIFCRKGVRLSAMLAGDPYFAVHYYETEAGLAQGIEAILRKA